MEENRPACDDQKVLEMFLVLQGTDDLRIRVEYLYLLRSLGSYPRRRSRDVARFQPNRSEWDVDQVSSNSCA